MLFCISGGTFIVSKRQSGTLRNCKSIAIEREYLRMRSSRCMTRPGRGNHFAGGARLTCAGRCDLADDASTSIAL